MVRYLGQPLDLSQLSGFQLVPVDEAAELATLKAGIVARFAANGVPYNVQSIKTDSAMILAVEFAYRKILGLEAINDAGKRLTLASSYGPALDQIASTYYADIGVDRAILKPASGNTPAVLESDDAFRKRIQLATEARTPGTLGGYEFYALTAAPYLYDVRAYNYASGLCSLGQVVVIVLGRTPNPNPALDIPAQDEAAQLALVQNRLQNRNLKEATDIITVQAATRTLVSFSVVLGLPYGPDPSIIVANATASLNAYLKECRTQIGRIMTRSSLDAALTVGGVRKVTLTGVTDDVDPTQVGVVDATVTSITPALFND